MLFYFSTKWAQATIYIFKKKLTAAAPDNFFPYLHYEPWAQRSKISENNILQNTGKFEFFFKLFYPID